MTNISFPSESKTETSRLSLQYEQSDAQSVRTRLVNPGQYAGRSLPKAKHYLAAFFLWLVMPATMVAGIANLWHQQNYHIQLSWW